ncbi:MAG: 50S ribosomal protein L4 [Candidatus Gribaldobacteria bacterium]|nr:50S ribosomal protein L4 [Candidatus Gribaldobacteria bacterium]
MKTVIYNQQGKKTGQAELPEEIFGVKVSPDLMQQVVVSQAANRRQGNAHCKDRSEVSGGGKKPWRQKGTGRARHGSTRSPIWKGGGVTFGPTNERVYKKVIPQKMRQKAILMALSGKVQSQFLIVLDSLKISEVKTKEINKILQSLPCKKQSILIGANSYNTELIRAARNIPQVTLTVIKDFNALDLLSSKYLLITQEGIEVLKKTFLKV